MHQLNDFNNFSNTVEDAVLDESLEDCAAIDTPAGEELPTELPVELSGGDLDEEPENLEFLDETPEQEKLPTTLPDVLTEGDPDEEPENLEFSDETPEQEELPTTLPDALTEGEPDEEPENLEFSDETPEQATLPDGVTQEMVDAYNKNVLDRTPHEVELVDLLQARQSRRPYDGQRSYAVDDNGNAIRDESGEIIDMPYGAKNSQRPDGYYFDGKDHVLESKRYNGPNAFSNLKQNMKVQAQKREESLGEDLDLTFSVAPTFTIDQADKLTNYVENTLGHSIQYQTR